MDPIVRSKCTNCPLLDDPAHVCPAQTKLFERYCFLVGPAGGPNREAYRRNLLTRAMTPDFSMPRPPSEGKIVANAGGIVWADGRPTDAVPPTFAAPVSPTYGQPQLSATTHNHTQPPEPVPEEEDVRYPSHLKHMPKYDIMDAVQRCPHRGGPSECKCNGKRKCAMGKWGGDVTLNNCIDCVQAARR